jgi:hypothetical protein
MVTRLSGGLTPADGADPRTFPAIWNATATEIETAQSDITTLESDVTTAQSDITTLQSDVTNVKLMTETSEQTSSYELVLGDAYKVVLANISSGTITVPTNASVAFPIGTIVNVYNTNATDLTIVGDTGVTVRNAGDLAQYGEVSLRKRATDEWVLAGSVS